MTDTAYLLAHQEVARQIQSAAPLSSPAVHAELSKLIADHVRIDPDGTTTVIDADGHHALDEANGYANLSVGGFMKRLEVNRPWLFSEGAHRPDKVPPPVSKPPKTITDAMIAARKGDATSMDAFDRSASPAAAKSKSNQVNITELMAHFKQGDPDAIQYIQHVK